MSAPYSLNLKRDRPLLQVTSRAGRSAYYVGGAPVAACSPPPNHPYQDCVRASPRFKNQGKRTLIWKARRSRVGGNLQLENRKNLGIVPNREIRQLRRGRPVCLPWPPLRNSFQPRLRRGRPVRLPWSIKSNHAERTTTSGRAIALSLNCHSERSEESKLHSTGRLGDQQLG